jgi:hypothetical protein
MNSRQSSRPKESLKEEGLLKEIIESEAGPSYLERREIQQIIKSTLQGEF